MVAALSLSMAGFVSIVLREGYSDNAIIPTKGDVPTVGFGSTTGVKMGDKITPPRAVARAAKELDSVYEAAVKRCTPVPMYQAEYDLYVDLTYNIGPGAYCKSTVARQLNAGNYVAACNAILLFKKAGSFDCSTPGNTRCRGLWDSRLVLHAKCLGAQ